MSRFKLRNKLRNAVDGMKTLAKVIHDESKFPGRPQPHMAAKNPLWGGEHDKVESSETIAEERATESVGHDELPKPVEKAPDGGEFWFLKDGDSDGWHETNPGLIDAEED